MRFRWQGSGRSRSNAVRLAMLMSFAALALVPAAAQAATLSGKVSGEQAGGTTKPLAGVTVTVIDPESQEEVGSTTTGTFGDYSVVAPSGVFDVRFQPAPGQAFEPTTVHDVDLTTPRTLDVALVATGVVTLSGTLRDAAGAPVPGVNLTLSTGTGSNASDTTGPDGSYSFAVAPDRYSLFAHATKSMPAGLPRSFFFQVRDIDLKADQESDLTLPPTSQLTIEALGSEDEPIANAAVQLPDLNSATSLGDLEADHLQSRDLRGNTDAQGRIVFTVFDGGAPFEEERGEIDPPSGSGYGHTKFTLPTVEQDTTVVVRFQPPGGEDTEPPILTIDAQPNGQNGWFTSNPVTVTAHAEDASIASLACAVGEDETAAFAGESQVALDLAVPVAGEGRHEVICVAADVAGNSSEATASVPIDVTAPPSAVLNPDRPPDYAGAMSWYRDQVTVSASTGEDPPLADGSPGSGLDPSSLPEPLTFSTSGVHEVVAAPQDLAGNIAGESVLVLDVDATAPTSTLSCPEDPVLEAAAVANWVDADGESGLTGAATGAEEIDTGEVGSHAAAHVATDLVGHSTTSECAYRVVYPFAVAGKTVLPPQFMRRQGKAKKVSVEFSLGGDRGLQIFRAGFPATQPIDCATGAPIGASAPAVAADPLRYRAKRGVYEYSWDVRGLGQKGCAALLLGLDDGTTREVWLEL
jgi:Carboxypeptidase regulatory-like domain